MNKFIYISIILILFLSLNVFGLSYNFDFSNIYCKITGNCIYQGNVTASNFYGNLDAGYIWNYSALTNKILLSWENITNRKDYLSNFTNDVGFINDTFGNSTYLFKSDESKLNTNSSIYWLNISSFGELNYKIIIDWSNISNRKEYLSNFTNDVGFINDTFANNTYILISNSSNLNVNYSQYVNFSNIQEFNKTHLSNFTDDLGDRGYNSLSNFTNNLELINDTFGNATYILQSNEAKLNVNSSDFWDNYNLSTDISIMGNFSADNITADYYEGQPLAGKLGSGIVYSSEFDNKYATINISCTGLNCSYPDMLFYLSKTDNTIKYCNISAGSVLVTDNQHNLVYVDNNCDIQITTFGTYLLTDLSPGGISDFFNAIAHSGIVEVYKGVTYGNKAEIATRKLLLRTLHLDVISGFGLTRDTFPKFTIANGEYVYLRSVVSATTINTSTTNLELVSHNSSSTWSFTDNLGINLTHCDNGTTLIPCSNANRYRRYYLFEIGYNNSLDTTELHELAALDSKTYLSAADCLNTEVNPLTFTLPDFYTYGAVLLYAYCGRASDTSWTTNFIDLRTVKATSTATGSIDTSVFVPYLGATNNVNIGTYNLSAGKVYANILEGILDYRNLTNNPTFLSNFTNNLDLINSSYGNATYIKLTSESNLNVNRSDFWDTYNISTDLNYKLLLYWDNITGKPTYLSNFTNNVEFINDTFGNSTYILKTSESNLNVNYSVYTNISNLQILNKTHLSNFTNDVEFINDTFGNNTYILQLNEANLNVNYSVYTNISNIQSLNKTHLSNFTNDIGFINDTFGNSTYLLISNENNLNVNYSVYTNVSNLQELNKTHLSNFTNDIGFINDTFGNDTYILKSNEENLNVNYSVYTNISNLQDLNKTHLSNFTNDMELINDTFGNATYILKSNEPNLNVNYSNSTGYWDTLNTPLDLNDSHTHNSLNLTNFDGLSGTHNHNAANISGGIFGGGNFTFPLNVFVNYSLHTNNSLTIGNPVISSNENLKVTSLNSNGIIGLYSNEGNYIWLYAYNSSNSQNVITSSKDLSISSTDDIYINPPNIIYLAPDSGFIDASSSYIQASEIAAGSNWTNLKEYPAGCSNDGAINTVGDTLTCIEQNNMNVNTSNSSNYWDNLNTPLELDDSHKHNILNLTNVVGLTDTHKHTVANLSDVNNLVDTHKHDSLNITNLNGLSDTHNHNVLNLTVLSGLDNTHLHSIDNLSDTGDLVDTHTHNALNITVLSGFSDTHTHNALNITTPSGLGDTHTHNAGNITSGTFGSGNFLFQNNLTVDTNTLLIDSVKHYIGIGTLVPYRKLDIQNSSSGDTIPLRVSNLGTGLSNVSLEFGLADQTGTTGEGSAAGRIMGGKEQVWTGGSASTFDGFLAFFTDLNDGLTEKMRITSAGYVGIGTTTPSDDLEIMSGNARIIFNQTTGPIRKWFMGTDHSPSGFYLLYDNSASSSRIFVDTNGFVGINTTTPQQVLEVSGNINITGTGNCLYVPGGGKLCGNTTCIWMVSPDGTSMSKVANSGTTC